MEMVKKIKLFILISVLLAIPISSSVEEKSLIKTQIEININANSSYDLFIRRDIATDYWSSKNWTLGLGKELKNIIIYDDFGSVNIKKIDSVSDVNVYTFDTHYSESNGYKPIYTNSTGNSMTEINDYLLELNLPIGIFSSNKSNESVSLTINLPESVSFLSSLYEDRLDFDKNTKKIELSYYNPSGYFSFVFLKNEYENDFIELKRNKKVFFVENKSLLVHAINEVFKNEEVIFDYPFEKKDFITISLSDTAKLNKENVDAAGLYLPAKVILIEKRFYNRFFNESLWVTNESMVSVLIHELTHYSSYFEYKEDMYPKWLDEGVAVYSETNYAEKIVPDALKTSPRYMTLQATKPSIGVLEEWYRTDKKFQEANYSYGFSGPEQYSLYGFVVNYYAREYGEANLKFALNSIRDKKKEMDKEDNIKNKDLENLAEFSLILYSGKSMSSEELFFPKRSLFLSNKTEFEKEMDKFITPFFFELFPSNNFTARLLASPETNKTERTLRTVVVSLTIVASIVIFIGLPIFVIILIYRRIKRKSVSENIEWEHRLKKSNVNCF